MQKAPIPQFEPIRFAVTIPSGFAVGNVSGNLECVSRNVVRMQLAPPLSIPQGMEAHLLNASIPFTQPNVGAAADLIPGYTAGNDRVSITWNGGARTDYVAPSGLYGFQDIGLWMNQSAVDAGWINSVSDSLFTFYGIQATQKVILVVDPSGLSGGAFPAGGVVIDFLNPGALALNDSMGPLLGWPTTGGGATLTIAGAGTAAESFAAPNVANFAIYSAYLISFSFLTNSYLNGQTGQYLDSFNVGEFQPNSLMTFQPPQKSGPTMAPGLYSQLTIAVTDQSGSPLAWSEFQAPVAISMMLEPIVAYTRAV